MYGVRTNASRREETFHIATVRHDIFLGELPDFPACLGDWQQMEPPVQRHYVTELVNDYTTATTISTGAAGEEVVEHSTNTATHTKTNFVDLAEHGGGTAPLFGIPWNGESWWRFYEHEAGGDRASLHYDLRFRSPSGTGTWRMDELEGNAGGNDA